MHVRPLDEHRLELLTRPGHDRDDAGAVPGNAAVAAVGDDADRTHALPIAAAETVILVVHDDDVAEAQTLRAELLDRVVMCEHDIAVGPLRAHAEPGSHQVRRNLERDIDAQPAFARVLQRQCTEQSRAEAPRRYLRKLAEP